MKVNKKFLALFAGILPLVLTGCSLGTPAPELSDEILQLRDKGIIAYEESTKGIPISLVEKNGIEDTLISGMYYVLHDETLYPVYSDKVTYVPSDEGVTDVDQNKRMYFNESSVINIPTLFEGDKIYYYKDSNVLDYIDWERYEDLGWTVGLANIRNTYGDYAYINYEDVEDNQILFLNSLESLKNLSKTKILIDSIGGIRITSDFIYGGHITGLTEGETYDLAIYNGTNYYYYSADVDTRVFRPMEVYASAKYYPLQDYLYEIEVPEYLLDGYYNIDQKGLFRLVRDTQYSEETEFNEPLLIQWDYHFDGDDHDKGKKIPYKYSEIAELNSFEAWDETCFGWVDKDSMVLDTDSLPDKEEKSENALVNFAAASKTQTELWLPQGKNCKIFLKSDETTGSISLRLSDGRMKKLNLNRIDGGYAIEINGTDERVSLIVQGLYHDYSIILTNATSYTGQDGGDPALNPLDIKGNLEDLEEPAESKETEEVTEPTEEIEVEENKTEENETEEVSEEEPVEDEE